ncbi:MAG: hypothetical protein JST49_03880 [Bacteroidetes bacterium]|nr:hypothetical protein [Bacteroidota bacterium]
MISIVKQNLSLTATEELYIAGLTDADKPRAWKNDTAAKAIKDSILKQLDSIQQQKCCYCGLKLWETSRGEIEHIASKSGRKKSYPEFTFVKNNLVLSCEYCNGSSKKGEIDVVFRYSTNYDKCEFKIVHPYFDNPNKHYSWVDKVTQIVIRHKTWKGKYSIILFELDSIRHSEARGKQNIYEKKVAKMIKKKQVIDRFNYIISFRWL